jgi:pullulanase
MYVKKILIMIVLILSLLVAINVRSVGAATANKLVIHYYRYDESIDEYDLWLWPSDGDGTNYAFDGADTYGATATITLSSTNLAGVDSIGILLKIGNWEEQDISKNRFINMTNPNSNGEVHVYLLQGEEFISYVNSDTTSCDRDVLIDPLECAQVIEVKLLDTYFNDFLNIEFSASVLVTSDDVVVLKDSVPVDYTGFTSGSNGTLVLDETVDVTKRYELQVDLGTEIVTSIIKVGNDYDSEIFQDAYNYDGTLGAIYGETETTFKLWAPVSSNVELNLYTAGHTTETRIDGDDTPEVHQMTYLEKGVWVVSIEGNLHGTYYTFNVVNNGSKVSDIQDPYSLSLGVNGLRSMVVNFEAVNPEGFDSDSGVGGFTSPNDAIIYEIHIRDLTSQAAWGGPSEYAKTYMGFTVRGTSFTNSNTGVTVSTGLDHLIELGITHVHLLPTYDQDNWNDELDMEFNWGYNPVNYNSPEGGYSTDPFDGSVRINEYQQMVMALHENGINVIQDVVYNHTGNGALYSFNKVVPNYFYRLNSDGSFSNGTGVGNETASERYMVRKYIVDSVEMWATEYHIDGFRFDLMAVHDVDTMNLLASKLELIDPNIFVYGEPWGGGDIALDYNLQAGKNNITNMPTISAFNDKFRDAIKGSTFNETGKGYVTNSDGIYDIMKGIEGSTNWGWGLTSTQSVNYVSAHDNLTLYDKLNAVNGETGYTKEIDYQARLSNSIVMFSQGIPFLHAGVDFLRTKGGNENSYDSSDIVNQLNWIRKSNYVDSFEYYKGIIEIRKTYESFKMVSESDIEENLTFIYPTGNGMIGYNLTKNNEDIFIYHNGGESINDITLPSGAWVLIADRDVAGLDSLGTFTATYPIEKAETLVFIRGEYADVIESPIHDVTVTIPRITNLFNSIFEGGTFNLTSNVDIYEYTIDGNSFNTVNLPTNSVSLEGLTPGVYNIQVKDSEGGLSEIFTLTIKEKIVMEVSCDEDPSQEKCDVIPSVCTDDQTLINNVCVSIPVCTEDQSLVDNECIDNEIPEPLPNPDDSTGCFGSIGSRSFIIFGIMALIGGSTLFFIRKH